jgi:hypothetical protein
VFKSRLIWVIFNVILISIVEICNFDMFFSFLLNRYVVWIGQLCLVVMLAGCFAHLQTKNDDPAIQPTWVDNPGEGVSASAGVHVRGRVAQEALAMMRAREELAKRLGVVISSESNTVQRVMDGRSSSTSDKRIQETVSSAEVKAVVKAKWLEPGSQVLWVWLVPSP